jgi:hypothetical protein
VRSDPGRDERVRHLHEDRARPGQDDEPFGVDAQGDGPVHGSSVSTSRMNVRM